MQLIECTEEVKLLYLRLVTNICVEMVLFFHCIN